ncbi:MAG: polysaccharide deacetylase family protein [Abditibacteriales bacterium]|nr:polysaccharide deacetylase family protein [Abditibacteriales bacterium]MDW8368287.1 polysaccharide deacetylase family protein [Abditibacteriales bacterium]
MISAFARILLFLVFATGIWAIYLHERPPTAQMGVRHIERLRGQPVVALTIDDGPHPLTTPLILETLKQMNVKATFFVVGKMMRRYPELARRIVEDGHALGNHTENHLRLTELTPAQVAREIERGFEAIDAVQRQPLRLFRPPGGGLNNIVLNYLHKHQIVLALWSLNPGDWSLLEAQPITDYVDKHLQAGDIILLHDGGVGTCQALPHIIRSIRKRGWRTVTVPEMLAMQRDT